MPRKKYGRKKRVKKREDGSKETKRSGEERDSYYCEKIDRRTKTERRR